MGAPDPAGRRWGRFDLRESLAGLSRVARLCSCGRRRMARDVAPEVRARTVEGGRRVAHFAHVVLCGMIWLCPVCAPRIRAARAVELDRACAWWLRERAAGTVLLVTLTMPHDYGDELAGLFDAQRAAWRALLAGKAGQKMRTRYGIAHWVRAVDVTVGAAGWHPHIHALFFCDRVLEPDEVAGLTANMLGRWAGAVEARGYRTPHERYGVQVERARSRRDVTRYVCQVVGEGDDDSAWGIANEVARTDLKRARKHGQRTPWQVLEDYAARRAAVGEWTDADDAADDRDRALWWEYEQATQRAQAMRWSDGLRALAGLTEERTKEEADKADETLGVVLGGEVLYTFDDASEWLAVCDTRGGRARVLRAAERWGERGCTRMVRALVARWQRRRLYGGRKPHRLTAGREVAHGR